MQPSLTTTGFYVIENVRREVLMMKYLQTSVYRQGSKLVNNKAINPQTCGLSTSFLHKIYSQSNASSEAFAAKRDHLSVQSLKLVNKGRSKIYEFYEEFEIEGLHCIVMESLTKGDLLEHLITLPDQKMTEKDFRILFSQICQAVQYLHARSVAHLDISLENICLDSDGNAKLIDFGLAARHPLDDADSKRSTALVSPFIRIFQSKVPNKQETDCTCHRCIRFCEEIAKEDDVSPGQSLRFLCRPICAQVRPPGTPSTMAPEIREGVAWDAFKADIFSLGMIMFMCLLGKEFKNARTENPYFSAIFSGKWMSPSVRVQDPDEIGYQKLSDNALSLLDSLIKPQKQRPTIDQVLAFPFFTRDHPGNSIPDLCPQIPRVTSGIVRSISC